MTRTYAYTCNGCPEGCEGSRLGGCAWHDGRDLNGDVLPDVAAELQAMLDKKSAKLGLEHNVREFIVWLRHAVDSRPIIGELRRRTIR